MHAVLVINLMCHINRLTFALYYDRWSVVERAGDGQSSGGDDVTGRSERITRD